LTTKDTKNTKEGRRQTVRPAFCLLSSFVFFVSFVVNLLWEGFMLREEQIDIRRKRAAEEGLKVQNLGRNRVFSDYQVSNPKSGGQYRVSIRGFDVGDNSCECPDFRTNTLGTCKHIEAVLAALRDQTPVQLRRRKAAVTHPEIYLNYGEQLCVGIHLPARYSDMLGVLNEQFFDLKGLWKGGDDYEHLIELVEKVPEQVTIFSDAMEFMEREIERREMARREEELDECLQQGVVPESLSELLKVELYPYQLQGALFAACRGRCILGDDMGLGKTVQTLAAAEILARERGIERVLVVAPASVKYQWESEVRKYTDREVQVIDGTTEQRRAQYRQGTFYRLINYEQSVRDLDELNAWQPDLIVLDEAQRIKNWESKTTRAVKKLRSRYALVLTGTPLENKLEELYSIVQFVDDRRLGPAFQFLHDHRVLDEDGKLLGYRNLEKIREKLAPILLRRTRAEVLTQLPARTDNIVYVEMADEQRTLYAEQHHSLARLLQKKYLSELDRRRIIACLTSLRMVCNSTFLIDRQTNVSPKLEELAEILGELLNPDAARKVVVFSQWELMQQKAVELVQHLGLGHAVLHGEVPGPERRKLLERFRDDPECRVFLSTDAGGTGLNLQSADTVINLEVPWNPAVLEQRIARVHRMGQHRPVQVYNLVMRDSIEERVLRVLEQKRNLFNELFSGTSDEIALDSMGQQSFLEAMRELFAPPVVESTVTTPVPFAPSAEPAAGNGLRAVPADGSHALVEAGVRFLEAIASAMAAGQVVSDPRTGQPALLVPVPSAEWLQRGKAALKAITEGTAPDDRPSE
jgi:superfamily II DNA or RNA helicase